MSNFRTKLLGLAALATLFAGASYGQITGCAPSAPSTVPGPATMRSEGTTELTADFVFACNNATTTATGVVQAFLSAAVTSKLNANNGAGQTFTEATLFICQGSTAALNLAQCEATPVVAAGAVVVTTVYGTVSGSTITFSNVGITGAVAANNPAFRISNVRVNASAVTLSATLTTVTEQILASAGGTSSATSPATTVGYILQSLQVTTFRPNPLGTPSATVTNYTTCGGNNPSATKTINASFLVEIKSLFAGAFKLQAPAANANSEQGSYTPADGSKAGLATQPTQIQIVLGNVPTGVTVYAPATLSVGGTTNPLSLQAVTSGGVALPGVQTTGVPAGYATNAAFIAAFPNSPATGALVGETDTLPVAYTPSGGSVTIIYQVTSVDNVTASYTIDVPIYVAFSATAFTTAQGPITVLEGYNPQAAAATATTIPNFAVQTATPVNATTIALCQTNLLFPYLTSTSGFDVGIALANTSTDPFGTTSSPGSCTLNFYGTGAPTPSTGVAAPGGTQTGGTATAFLLSSVAPGFSGYMIAVCSYQYGHGFAYIINGFGQPNGTTMGYLAEVIANSGRTGTANPAELNTF